MSAPPKPFKHQADEFADHGLDPFRGLFWEQGCGKTKPVIMSAAELYRRGEIDALLVIAPNGVHRNWVSDELPTHLDPDVAEALRTHIWYSTASKTHAREFTWTLEHEGVAVLVMSYNAVWTDRGRDAWKAFLTKRKCMYVLDESQRVKSPNAKWTKRIMGSVAKAPYRRCLSGTPVDNSPFDIYTQCKFLDPDIWTPFGIKNFAAFKNHFGIWERFHSANGAFPKCVAFKNLPQLYDALHRVGHRLTKDEVLDLPEKLYSKRYVELTPKQRKMYAQMRAELMLELESGEELNANLAIVKLLRLQQIVCGYVPNGDDSDELVDIPGGNPRLALLGEITEDLSHKAIIWARFRRDIDLICDKLGDGCVRVDGSVTGPARGEALDAFQKGDIQFLVANPAAISTGVTLTAARTVIYYSNSYKLSDRLQSEDRAHRIGQKFAVHYIDLVAPGTVDTKIVESLRRKVNIASQITGDALKQWI